MKRVPSKSQVTGKQAAAGSRGDHPYPQALFQQMQVSGSQSPYNTSQQHNTTGGGQKGFFSESANVHDGAASAMTNEPLYVPLSDFESDFAIVD